MSNAAELTFYILIDLAPKNNQHMIGPYCVSSMHMYVPKWYDTTGVPPFFEDTDLLCMYLKNFSSSISSSNYLLEKYTLIQSS